MASTLRDRIAQGRKQMGVGPDGQPLETTGEEVQTLADRVGLASAPIDPQSTATIGGNQHQQKMAGTPAQVGAAIQQASLATADRQRQVRSQATEQEQASQQKTQSLASLGEMGPRVDSFIEAQRQKLAQQQPQMQQQVQENPSGIQGMPTDPAKLANVKQLAQQLLANPGDQNLLLQLNQALGRNTNSQLTAEEIQQLYQGSTKAIADSGAQVVDDALTVNDLVAAGDFPYTNSELSLLLGVPEQELGNYSVKQLRDRLDAVAAEEMRSSQQLQQQAGSNLLGSAERATARQLGQEASATGVRASEADFRRIEDAVANGETIIFGGKEMPVDELLKDDTISGMISEYLNSAPGSSVREQLEQTEPELIQFINSNKAVLEDAAKQIADSTKQFQETQEQNQKLNEIAGRKIDKGLMDTLLPGWDQLQASGMDVEGLPIFQRASSLPPTQAATYIDTLNQLSADPSLKDLVPELADLSQQELQNLELEKGITGSPKLRALIQNRNMLKQLASVSPDDPDAIIQLMSGGSLSSPEVAQQFLKQATSLSALGVEAPNTKYLDWNRDGQLDSPKDILKRMKRGTSPASLRDILAGSSSTFQSQDLGQLEDVRPGSSLSTLLGKLGNAAADGKITDAEIAKENFSRRQLSTIFADKEQLARYPENVRKELQKQYDAASAEEWRKVENTFQPITVSGKTKDTDLTSSIEKQQKNITELQRRIQKAQQTGAKKLFPVEKAQSLVDTLKQGIVSMQDEIKAREKRKADEKKAAEEEKKRKREAEKRRRNPPGPRYNQAGVAIAFPEYYWDDKKGDWVITGYKDTWGRPDSTYYGSGDTH